ncbi:hypothetical protein NA23_07745 [Fervidobacterium islandicum]|uniref:Uncharacterized protein n=1 Tax=Fervidobacterium islandicum TaxID=2423 RepID=A0AAI8CMD7_FERIS|nr:hypothetical protein [Fervidobacterium islandicum]AMW33145.2 hypothetical protein NA23_07745 [Fervidobacterium islandicum]
MKSCKVLVMVLSDKEGVVYDIWYHPGSKHELTSLREKLKKSGCLKKAIESKQVIGDKGYRGSLVVDVCEKKEEKSKRQPVGSVNSILKKFNKISGWRLGITLLVYLYSYAIGYSYFRNLLDFVCS